MGVSFGACLVVLLGLINAISKYFLNVLEPWRFENLTILYLGFCCLVVQIHSCSTDDLKISVSSRSSQGSRDERLDTEISKSSVEQEGIWTTRQQDPRC